MKEQVLKQMIAVVDGMKSFKTDFYKYDLPAIVKVDESIPFMWAVGSGSTSLLLLDEKAMKKRADENERYRFHFMHNPKECLDVFKQQTEYCPKVFWYDGNYLEQIDVARIDEYLNGTFAPIVYHVEKYIAAHYGGTDESYTEQITIEFSTGAERLVRQILATDEADKLRAVLKRFKSWPRNAKKDCVFIGLDFMEKSFTFSRIINDSCILNGGIIYEDGKWTMHT